MEEAFAHLMSELEAQLGGRDRFIQALIATENPKAKPLVQALGKEENAEKSVGELCLELKTDPSMLMKSATDGSLMLSMTNAFLSLAQGMPQVIHSSIDTATNLGPDGFKDRELLMKVGGLLKDGGGIHLNLNQQINTVPQVDQFLTASSEIGKQNPFDIEIEAEDVSS